MAVSSSKQANLKASASKKSISNETKTEAMKVAKATQKPGQTKEQTKLIAQGIEKGIAEYKNCKKVRLGSAIKPVNKR
ncbi:hypothetical protein TUM4433_23950 [Shewanella schlegeliana]|nr:hypothetical protein TUM4433_23950 [Shewanella schlegeliana]